MTNLIQIQRSEDSVYTLNKLYNEGKVFIMDNHLAAAWCWSQKIDFNESYNLFHIDKHYDLLNGSTDYLVSQLSQKNFDFQNASIEHYISIEEENPKSMLKSKIFRFDNYITIFRRMHPSVFNNFKFATHKDGTAPVDWKMEIYDVEIYELPTNLSNWINETDEKWIVNIDIDYFFAKNSEDKYFQFLTDEYIEAIAQQILNAIEKIQVITIALSSTFCGGMTNSMRVAEIFCKSLNVSIK